MNDVNNNKSNRNKIKCFLGFHKARVGKYGEKSIPSDCWCLGCGKLLYLKIIRNGIEIKNKRQWQ